MKVRFQADNDLDQRIVAATLRLNSSIDFRTAPDAKLHSLTDAEVLAFAASDGRVIVSRDRRTMPTHFYDFIRDARSPGLIIISRKVTIGQAAEWLYLLWEASDAQEYANIIYSLP
jgi:predicted nuclease of predicted toxin-antitoxin system